MAIYSLMPLDAEGKLGPLSLAGYRAFFAEGAYTAALWNSVAMTAVVVVCSTLLAYPFAYAIAYLVPRRWQRCRRAWAGGRDHIPSRRVGRLRVE